MTKVAAVIQARMGSTRFPGKVLQPLAGKPVLWHVVHRLRKCRHVHQVALATSTESADDSLEAFAAAEDIGCVRGPEDNVLKRYELAAERYQPDVLVRVTGDAPLLDPPTLDRAIAALLASGADYVVGEPGIATIHEGFDPFTRRSLERLVREAGDDPVAREHVSSYFKVHPGFARVVALERDPDTEIEGVRASVDTPADIAFLEAIYERLQAPAGEIDVRDVVMLLRAEPHLKGINAHIHQKEAEEISRHAIFRCDGDATVGMGHVTRCLAVAEALRSAHAFGVTFAMVRGDEGFQRVRSEGFRLAAKPDTACEEEWVGALVKETSAAAIVLDVRTELSGQAVLRWRSSGHLVATLDDTGERGRAADLVFSPPVPQVRRLSPESFHGELLAGWEWIPLAGHFSGQQRRLVAGNPNILVTMGGSDPNGLTFKALEALQGIPDKRTITVVLGPGFGAADEVERLALGSAHRIRTLRDVKNLAPLMATADLAVASFGVTAYELAAAGVPSILLCISDDHAESATALDDAGLAVNLGHHEGVTAERLRQTVELLLGDDKRRDDMSSRARAQVDDRGAMRIAARIASSLCEDLERLKKREEING